MSRLTRLVSLTRLISSESTRSHTVVSARLRHVLAGSTAGVAPRRQFSYTRGEWSKFKTLAPTPPAIHTHAPEPEIVELNHAVDRFGNEEAPELPEELMRNVVKLTGESTAEGGVCDVYVVGTKHWSEESCKQVRAIISFLKPKTVFLELCNSRKNALYPQEKKIEIQTVHDMINMWRKNGSIFATVYHWLVANLHVHFNFGPYSEFSVAWEEVCKYKGSAILGDRPMEITILRIWRKVPIWHLLRCRKIKTDDLRSLENIRSLEDLRNLEYHQLESLASSIFALIPPLKETLVDERDKYMARVLREHAKSDRAIVAIVGRGHLRGIKKEWDNPTPDSELEEIKKIPPENPNGKALTCMGVAFAGIAILPCVGCIYLLCKYVS